MFSYVKVQLCIFFYIHLLSIFTGFLVFFFFLIMFFIYVEINALSYKFKIFSSSLSFVYWSHLWWWCLCLVVFAMQTLIFFLEFDHGFPSPRLFSCSTCIFSIFASMSRIYLEYILVYGGRILLIFNLFPNGYSFLLTLLKGILFTFILYSFLFFSVNSINIELGLPVNDKEEWNFIK